MKGFFPILRFGDRGSVWTDRNKVSGCLLADVADGGRAASPTGSVCVAAAIHAGGVFGQTPSLTSQTKLKGHRSHIH